MKRSLWAICLLLFSVSGLFADTVSLPLHLSFENNEVIEVGFTADPIGEIDIYTKLIPIGDRASFTLETVNGNYESASYTTSFGLYYKFKTWKAGLRVFLCYDNFHDGATEYKIDIEEKKQYLDPVADPSLIPAEVRKTNNLEFRIDSDSVVRTDILQLKLRVSNVPFLIPNMTTEFSIVVVSE